MSLSIGDIVTHIRPSAHVSETLRGRNGDRWFARVYVVCDDGTTGVRAIWNGPKEWYGDSRNGFYFATNDLRPITVDELLFLIAQGVNCGPV